MHKDKRERVITGTGGQEKEIVLGMVERGGQCAWFRRREPRQEEFQKRFASTSKPAPRFSAMSLSL